MQEILFSCKASVCHYESGQTLAQIAQRHGSVSVLAGVQTRHGPDQL